MSRRTAARLAWAVWALASTLLALGALFQFLTDPSQWSAVVWGVLAVLPSATVGALLASRRAGGLIGWIFCLFALLAALQNVADPYAVYTLVTAPGSLPGGVALAWIGAWILSPANCLLGYLALTFPSGRLPSRRWRLYAWLYTGMAALVTLAAALQPGPLQSVLPALTLTNPLAVTAAASVSILTLVQRIENPLVILVGSPLLALQILRFRRAGGEERQQFKWVVYALVLMLFWVTVFPFLQLLHVPVSEAAIDVAWGLAYASLPIAVGIAILKYRLYDIDLLINRTLVYGLLTALLGAVYAGLILGLQALVSRLTDQTGESPLAIVVSTLAIAALVRPLRRRIQALIDRRFYRRKYDAQQTLATFSAALRQEVDLEQIRERLLSVVQETMQPTQVWLWLRPPAGAPSAPVPRRAAPPEANASEPSGLAAH